MRTQFKFLNPSILIQRLYQRCVIESRDEVKVRLLDAIAAVYAVFGGAEPAVPCMPYLAHLLHSRSDSAAGLHRRNRAPDRTRLRCAVSRRPYHRTCLDPGAQPEPC